METTRLVNYIPARTDRSGYTETQRANGSVLVEDYGRGITFARTPDAPHCAKVYLWVNHAYRKARPVAWTSALVLFVYEMPGGRSYLQEWIATADGSFEEVRSLNAKRLPACWQMVLDDDEIANLASETER